MINLIEKIFSLINILFIIVIAVFVIFALITNPLRTLYTLGFGHCPGDRGDDRVYSRCEDNR